jgi:protein N-terminal methyltransferase
MVAILSGVRSREEQGQCTLPGTVVFERYTEACHRIGRVTEGLLMDIAEEIDIVEPVAKFTAPLQGRKGIRSIENIGMSDWRPTQGVVYDLVWIQWCLGYLSDEQVVEHLRYCKSALRTDKSLVVVKENISTAGTDMFDSRDGSVTRQVNCTIRSSS